MEDFIEALKTLSSSNEDTNPQPSVKPATAVSQTIRVLILPYQLPAVGN